MRHHIRPFFARFGSKLLLEVAPATLASLVGGFFISQWVRSEPPKPVTVAVQPAGPEMLALLRDEHALLTELVRKETQTQLAANRAADADRDLLKNAAAERAHAAQQKLASIAKPAPKPVAKPAAAKAQDTRPDSKPDTRVAGEPLQLADLKNPDPSRPRPPAELASYQTPQQPAAKSEDGFFKRHIRSAVTAVERVPNMLRDAADWLTGESTQASDDTRNRLQVLPRVSDRSLFKLEM